MESLNAIGLNRAAAHRASSWLAVALVVALGMAELATAGTILIDDFSTPNPHNFFVIGSGTNPSKAMTELSDGAIGGERDTLVNVVGVAKPNSLVGLLGYDTNYTINALQIGTNGLAPTVTTLMYSGIHDGNTLTSVVNNHGLGGGLGVDLTGGGTNDHFLLSFFSSDAQPTAGLDLSVTITSPGGKSSTGTARAINSLLAFNVSIPFSSLVGNASLTHVDSIKFVFNGTDLAANVDYEVKTLAATGNVPEPASGTLLAIAVGALALPACVRRRRRLSPREMNSSL